MDERYVSITELRRSFGKFEKLLEKVDFLILTKRGKPFAILKASPEVKRKMRLKTVGAFKGTELEKEEFWKEILERKSRKKGVNL